MDTKLYVGNLPYRTSEEDLRTMFAKAGNVTSVALIKDRETGRSKGFGFVEMSSQAEAEEAIKLFNGFSMEGRELKVNIARPREDRPRDDRGGGGGGGYGRSSGGGSGGGGGDRGGPRDRNRREGGGGTRRY